MKDNFDIKEVITNAVEKIKDDKALQELFMKDPVRALEKTLGIDLPNELLDPVVDGIKAQLTAEKLGEAANFFKKLF